MVQAMIKISDDANQVLNIVKAKFKLKDKSQAIERIVSEYGKNFLEPQLRPEFVDRVRKTEKEGFKKFSSAKDLDKDIMNS